MNYPFKRWLFLAPSGLLQFVIVAIGLGIRVSSVSTIKQIFLPISAVCICSNACGFQNIGAHYGLIDLGVYQNKCNLFALIEKFLKIYFQHRYLEIHNIPIIAAYLSHASTRSGNYILAYFGKIFFEVDEMAANRLLLE